MVGLNANEGLAQGGSQGRTRRFTMPVSSAAACCSLVAVFCEEPWSFCVVLTFRSFHKSLIASGQRQEAPITPTHKHSMHHGTRHTTSISKRLRMQVEFAKLRMGGCRLQFGTASCQAPTFINPNCCQAFSQPLLATSYCNLTTWVVNAPVFSA